MKVVFSDKLKVILSDPQARQDFSKAIESATTSSSRKKTIAGDPCFGFENKIYKVLVGPEVNVPAR